MNKQNFQNLDQFEYWNLIREIGSFNDKWEDSVATKSEIFNRLIKSLDQNSITILLPRFNPIALHLAKTYSVSVIGPTELRTIFDMTNIKLYPSIDAVSQKYDVVLALDEYFTFARSEQEQIDKIKAVSDLAKDVIVTTLRDYKNQDFRDREFSQPLAVHAQNETKIFLEYHHYDYNDKNAWTTNVYEMQDKETVVTGPFARRSMFFKQMAKFSIDAGAKEFYVHKNLMYKSLIKKNYEHVISISF